MEKTRDLLKKIRDNKGTCHGHIKDRNGMDLREEKILRSDGKIHREIMQKKILMTQITMMV